MSVIDRTRRSIGCIGLALAFLAGCGAGGPAPSNGSGTPDFLAGQIPGLTTTFQDVRWADGTVMLDPQAVAQSYHSMSADGATLRFAPTDALRALSPGKIAVFPALAARRITSVAEEGSELAIVTEAVPVNEVIHDGRLGFGLDLHWDKLPDAAWQEVAAANGLRPIAALPGAPGSLPDTALTKRGTEFHFAGNVKGFQVDLRLSPTADGLLVTLSAASANMRTEVKGTISGFSQTATASISDGETVDLSSDLNGVKANLQVSWHAFASRDPVLDQQITAFEIPLGIPIPFAIGPIPARLTIKANARFVPALDLDSSSGGSFVVKYDSDQGWTAGNGLLTPKSNLRTGEADLGSTETVTAGSKPTGFGFGFEFPRFELSILDPPLLSAFVPNPGTYAFVTFNTYVAGEWTPGTLLTADIPPCQTAWTQFSAIAGFQLGVFGIARLNDQKELWSRRVDKYKDNKPCTLTGT